MPIQLHNDDRRREQELTTGGEQIVANNNLNLSPYYPINNCLKPATLASSGARPDY